jgi:glutamate carboxypeptidase
MTIYDTWLTYVDAQYPRMRELLIQWTNINTGSENLPGLARMIEALSQEFAGLEGESRIVELQPRTVLDDTGAPVTRALGKAFIARKRPQARLRVFLCCHMDTVYPADHPFQTCVQKSEHVLNGPGVADAKGGVVVMLKALEAFERSPFANNLGWEILINPDEEIGSPGSRSLLDAAAVNNHLGLVFEPSYSDGALVSARKGSGNFTVKVTGKAAHAGREPHFGRNAINAVAEFVVQLNSFPFLERGITINVGYVHGGGPVNVVPDKAVAKFNVRISEPAEQALVEEHIRRAAERIGCLDGIAIDISGGFARPPKPLDTKTNQLLNHLAACGRELGLDLRWSPSGGACDGNNLAARGLVTVDSLGVTGGNIHSSEEYVLLPSLPERAKLTALLLMKLAAGEIAWPV